MNNIRFSIIIPVYNSEKYIKRCIESILNQTLSEIEVIAINDGSNDRSLSILQELASNDLRLKVLSQENMGPSAARNLGLKYSKGEYISFVDSDDWLELDAYRQLYASIENNNYPDIVMFNNYINDSIKNKPFLKSGLYDKQAIRELIYPRAIESLDKRKGSAVRASVWLRIFKRKLIFNHIFFPLELTNNEDLVFNFKSIIKANSFLYLGNLYIYHNCMTENSLSRGYKKNALEGMKPLFGILSAINDSFDEYDFSSQINERVFRTLVYCVENEFYKNYSQSIINKYINIKHIFNDRDINKYLIDYKPIREKSKIMYFFFYRKRIVIGAIILALYKVSKQQKRIQYV